MSMTYPAMRTIKATEARQSFGEVIRRAVVEGEQFVVEKNDLPVVVILSIRDYEEMRKAAALENLRALSRAANRAAVALGLTPEKLDEEIDETKARLFQERYGGTDA